MKLKELFKEMQEVQMKKLEGLEILGFKTKIYNHSSRGKMNRSLYGYRYVDGKKTQIFLGKPDSIEEIKDKIQKFIDEEEKKK
ncbi:MAG: hypothetical protein AB1390_09310 [Nitrospirota bacterium]